MPYYPKSQLKLNLYTNGGEYILSTTKELYIGYYYQTSANTSYTGKTPEDGTNILLIKNSIIEPNNITPQNIIYNIPTVDILNISFE
jgi:hypothetical protein